MTHMRFVTRVALAGALLMSIAQLPAAAGTPDDPEIQKPCNQGTTFVETYTPWADICAVWFDAVYDEAKRPSVTGLRLNVAMAGNVGDRPPVYLFEASWNHNGCRQGWFVNDQDGMHAARVAFFERCEGESEPRRTELDRSLATTDGKVLSVTLPLSTVNAAAQAPLGEGSLLTDLRVSVLHSLQTSAGPGGTLEHTGAGPGRDYQVGGGRPHGSDTTDAG